MNEQVKKDWVALLRSGKILQGHGKLKDPEGRMCCLGVLCELHRRQTGRGRWLEVHYNDGLNDVPSMFFLTLDVMKWADLNVTDPKVSVGLGRSDFLSNCNDDKRFTFVEIAELIEKSL